VKVSLNECLDLAKEYSTPKSSSFINGVLDKIVANLREEGLINKVGRGMIE
jgi:N utilization substance protein B